MEVFFIPNVNRIISRESNEGIGLINRAIKIVSALDNTILTLSPKKDSWGEDEKESSKGDRTMESYEIEFLRREKAREEDTLWVLKFHQQVSGPTYTIQHLK